jgi:WD40 repeat protein
MSARFRLVIFILFLALTLIGFSHSLPALRNTNSHAALDDSVDPRLAPPPRPGPEESPLPVGAVRRFGVSAFEPRGRIDDLMFAANGAWLVGCGEFGEARIWNAQTGRLIRRFRAGDDASCIKVSLTPDNRTLSVVVDSCDRTQEPWRSTVSLRRYDVASGQEIACHILPHVGITAYLQVAFSPDGLAVYAGDRLGPLAKYDLATGRLLWQYRPYPQNELQGIAVSPDSRTVAVSSSLEGPAVRLLDAETGQVLQAHPGSGAVLGALEFAPDGRSLAVATNQYAELWNFSPLAPHRTFGLIHTSKSCRPIFFPDGRTIGIWGWTDPPPWKPPETEEELRQFAIARHLPPVYSLHLLDAKTGDIRSTHFIHRDDLITPPAALSPHGATLVQGGRSVSFWDLTPDTRWYPAGNGIGSSWSYKPSFSKDGQSLLFSEVDGDEVVTRDMIANREVSRERRTDETRLGDTVRLGSLFYTLVDDRFIAIDPFFAREPVPTIVLQDAATKLEIARIKAQSKDERVVAMSQDGKQLCTFDKNTVRVYDVATRKLLKNLGPGALRPNRSQSWMIWCYRSPDGRYLAVTEQQEQGGPQTVTIRETSDWRTVRVVRMEQEEMFHWSSAERFLIHTQEPSDAHLFSGDRTHRTAEWDVTVGCVSSRTVRLPVDYWTVSPNGRMLAAWGTQQEDGGFPIRLIEVESGKERYRFVCDEPCQTAYFSPGGRYLLGHHPGVPYILWDINGTHTESPESPNAEALERAWGELGTDDAVAAFWAIRLFARFPDRSIPLLRSKILPVALPDPAPIARLVDALGSEDFQERERAGAELEQLGRSAASALRAAARSSPSPEVIRRASDLLRKIGSKSPGEPELLSVRAVEVLEWANTPEAAKLLQSWGSGAEGARLTEEAKGALARMKGR